MFLNGRFLRQSVTGVQRFSAEIAAAIDRLVAVGEWPDTVVLAPRPAQLEAIGRVAAPYGRLRLREVGRMHGHLWEQAELPTAARGGVLVSLGNTAPVLAGRRQVVVIHDAGVFDTPKSYSLRFRAWYKALQHGLVRTGAQVATVSEFSRRRIVARLGLDPARITVMYEGADHILRVPADPCTLTRYNLRPRQFALVVSNRVAHKNLAALHEAAAALERRGMVIAVAGAADLDVFRDIPGAGFAERRLGRVSDTELRALYENAACLLFPSRYRGLRAAPGRGDGLRVPGARSTRRRSRGDLRKTARCISPTATSGRSPKRSSGCRTGRPCHDMRVTRNGTHPRGLSWTHRRACRRGRATVQ